MVAAFKIYKHVSPDPAEKQLSHLQFRIEISEIMATKAELMVPRQRLGGPTATLPNQVKSLPSAIPSKWPSKIIRLKYYLISLLVAHSVSIYTDKFICKSHTI